MGALFPCSRLCGVPDPGTGLGATDGLGAWIDGNATCGFCGSNDEFGDGGTYPFAPAPFPPDPFPPFELPPPPLDVPDEDVAVAVGEGDFVGVLVGFFVGVGVLVGVFVGVGTR
ncbi:hypothetical protein [Spirillospora sp. CA-128828]|uniref:hypothetical protein n=1 Tax=Spirillospora sp. CA-128828 TaxID=3240033 RepID=UPI003D916FB0